MNKEQLTNHDPRPELDKEFDQTFDEDSNKDSVYEMQGDELLLHLVHQVEIAYHILTHARDEKTWKMIKSNVTGVPTGRLARMA